MSNHSYHISLLNTLEQLYTLFTRLKKQNRYIQHQLPAVIDQLQKGLSSTLAPKHFPRIIKYWQLGLNIVCNNFYTLTGSVLSAGEQERILLLSIFGPLYDDLFDDNTMTPARIEVFSNNPEKLQPVNFEEELLCAIYLKLLASVPDRERFRERLLQVYKWQKESLKQRDPFIAEKTLYEITYQKSYHSILLYHTVLDQYPHAQVLEMLYPVAGLLQLTNDAFDVYKDSKAGVYTIPDRFMDYRKIKKHFLNEIADVNRKLNALPYLQPNRKKYAITIHCLNAMGWIALDQLGQVLKDVKDPAVINTIDKKQLICDMDTLPRKIKWIRQVQHLSNYSGN
ncbi:hypothetical protein A8C56_04630 [Niabella ginsenosidivorans]|uniref:Uncharacterized protein n=1 Tax=Niabella ginsenosidivorans TaxID=1176587 RepID=A0A1A9I0W5_9BACT|nr:class 1 isoprenoid biosynthesis enzyme [Niabella ginsenosidivorans]ANH80360.1 hypothetical protein A8C56_04630 [Niabella ginsenosidivorans]